MARRGGSGGRSSGRSGASKGGGGRARSRRDEVEDEDGYDERPRRGGRSANAGPNMQLILGSVGGLILLLVIGGFLISSTEDARRDKERKLQEEMEAAEQAAKDKIAAAEAKAAKLTADKEAREAPWNKALEKVLAPLKKMMNKDNKVKRYILAFSFANDGPTFYFPVRPKFFTGDAAEVRETCQSLCDLVEELCLKGFAHAKEGGYPVVNQKIEVHFTEKWSDAEKKDNPDAGKWKREVATYTNGTLTMKR